MVTAKTRQKILKTFLDLLAQRPYEEVSLPLVAETAGVRLSEMRSAFPSRLAMVAAFAEAVDKEVLDERDEDMADQPARDRLFDVLMSRIDALSEHKEAVRALHKAARQDPALALEFNTLEVRSQKWMLIAAGIDVSGVKGGVMGQGLAVAFARVVGVWLNETDEGMPRTMAKLDTELDRGSSFMRRFDRVEGVAKGVRSFFRKASERRRDRSSASESAEKGYDEDVPVGA
ncbi:TetR/AcrR family transcriptional regulator [Rhodobacterales bacterium]|nr:TetR/AcrR family transcriptional regulator [Rhodobacterales bacterium]